LDQSSKHDTLIKASLADTKQQLDKIGATLRKAVERISAKERHINKEFDHLGN
jgi:chaperonin cofactor prefoldin